MHVLNLKNMPPAVFRVPASDNRGDHVAQGVREDRVIFVQADAADEDADLQGYLAHKKHPPPRTLKWDYT